MPQPKLPTAKHRHIHQCIANGMTRRETAKEVGVSIGTVSHFAREPLPPEAKPIAIRAELPESWADDFHPFRIESPGMTLVISDIHIPFHIGRAVEEAIAGGKRAGAKTVLLNGDVCDFHKVSKYPHDGSAITYREEIDAGCQFLAYLRKQFPKARVVYKEGNHEERLEKHILGNAPALFGLEETTLRALLRLKDWGIEHVADQRVVHLGKLRVIHGHEYGGRVSAPLNGAAWLFRQANGKPAMCGHLHQTSEHGETDIDSAQLGAWSVGCLSQLNPRYRRLSRRINHGFALVDVAKDGTFDVMNQRIGAKGV